METMNNNGTKYTNDELINNICKTNYFSRAKNYRELKDFNLEHAKKYHLGNNVHIAFFAHHGGIKEVYYWGEKKIKKEHAIKRLNQIFHF